MYLRTKKCGFGKPSDNNKVKNKFKIKLKYIGEYLLASPNFLEASLNFPSVWVRLGKVTLGFRKKVRLQEIS